VCTRSSWKARWRACNIKLSEAEVIMSFFRWIAVAMLGALPLVAIAGPQTPPDPMDARASGTPFTYASAFESYRAASEEQASPDKHWRAVNDLVGKLGGHSGHTGQGNHDAGPATTSGPDAASSMPVRPDHGVHH
jgi:hypothetical protein